MASARLSRTQTSGTRTKATFSAWIKRSALGSNQAFFGIYGSADDGGQIEIRFQGSGEGLHITGQATNWRRTNKSFRDVNGWYHVVVAFDTTQSTAGDRVKVYVNGEQETSFAASGDPSQNFNLPFGLNGATCLVGCRQYSNGVGDYFDGEMAHVHLVDGTAYTPTTFGETDATTGIWKPKVAPSVTYGTNGFFLKFDNSANMGLDSSGQSNNLTTNGTIIQTKDTPDNVFCTNNKLWFQESTRVLTLTNVNNMLSGGGSATWYQVPGTLAFSKGKYYWECKFNAGTNLDKNTPGVMDIEKTNETGQFQDKAGSVFYKNEDGGETRLDGTTSTADYGTLAQNDILGVAVDMDAGTPTVKYYKNGTLLATVNASSFSGKTVTPAHMVYTSGEYQVNYGNGYFGTTAVSSAQNPDDGVGIFEHDPPSGYRALCTKSINAQEYS